MRKIKALVASVVLLLAVSDTSGFVMIGPVLGMPNAAPAGTLSEVVADANGTAVSLNITDDLGGPKELKTFFRWQTPYLTYSFDLSFVQYFGLDGMEAVHDAFRVLNDFFIPEDKSRVGVSQLDFARDGFLSNYNTAWVNTTAQNRQIIDVKSLTLGMLLNHLGVGNPHRYAYTIRSITVNSTQPAATQWNFNARLKNYDPMTWEPTDEINGVTYSYRLIHDAPPQAGAAIAAPPNIADMEEFTTDTSGNAWTSVAGIVDAFYGNTAIYWTDSPTLFNFGVYYDGMNAMGGRYEPRHALTYDDAGALKYLYRTNNFVTELLHDPTVVAIRPAQFLPKPMSQNFLNPNNNFVGPNPSFTGSGRYPRTFPRRTGNTQLNFPTTSPWLSTPSFIIGLPGGLPAGSTPVGTVNEAVRGGIDKMQFYHVPFDSLMDLNFSTTNFVWTDTFVTRQGQTISGANNTTPGASQYVGPGQLRYTSQTLGRTVTRPDFLFVADDLGQAPDGVPVAWSRTGLTLGGDLWIDNYGLNGNQTYWQGSTSSIKVGPGVINTTDSNSSIVYAFSKLSEGFEVIWSGESSVTGNRDTYNLWGHIKGPGANDLVVFPDNSMIWRLENEITPKVAPPTISMISDNGGLAPIAPNSYTRTQETISIIGSGLAGATAIEIMSGNNVLQTIFPADRFLVNDTRLDIPPGVLSLGSEGVARQIRVWNTIGPSANSPQIFSIYTGRAMVTGTVSDGGVYDRAQPLTVYGFGFKSIGGRVADGGKKLTHLRIEDGQGNLVFPTDGNSTSVAWEVSSDTEAVLPMNSLTSAADGAYRLIRVSRENGSLSTLSPTNNVNLINYITTKPNVTAMRTIESNGTAILISESEALRRDRALELSGTAMNTAIALEIVKQDGSSFSNPVVVNLPAAGVTVDDNGTRIQISADVFPWPDADGYMAADRCKFKVYNAVGNYTTGATFNVNVQPVYGGTGGFLKPGTFNRDKDVGDDVIIVGTGFKAVSEIRIVDVNGADLNGIITGITLPNPGVIVTDTSISIDTSVAQFNNGANADSTISNHYRRFQLVSKRDLAMSSQITRFEVGVPPSPVITLSTSPSILNYRRDHHTISATGSGLGVIDKIEIVDINGNPISGVSAMEGANLIADLSNWSASLFQLDANASAWVGQGHLIDSATILADGNGTRRLKVSTPFGTATSALEDGFTISATPNYLAANNNNAAETFAGSADFNGSDYNASVGTGLLVINGSNFRGAKNIWLMDSNGTDANGTLALTPITIDPIALPAGITINAAGTQITMSKTVLDNASASWITSTALARHIRVESAGDQNATTPPIITKE